MVPAQLALELDKIEAENLIVQTQALQDKYRDTLAKLNAQLRRTEVQTTARRAQPSDSTQRNSRLDVLNDFGQAD